jgi:ATP adenylyltransferase/5',5'''-P-1,P-4-tetraphosphate phosphorylase II
VSSLMIVGKMCADQFLVSYLMEPGLKSRLAADDEAADSDPFDANHLDPYLFVSMIPPMHALVLNKYTSIQDHVSRRVAF